MKYLLSMPKKNEKGFTLAEVSVAMIIGVVTFGFAVVFLVSFSSSSLSASAKTDATLQARNGLTIMLKTISSGAAVPKCTQWKDKSINDSPPTLTSTNVINCLDLQTTSQVLTYADQYALCFNLADAATSSSDSVTLPTKVGCVFTGNGTATCKDATQNDYDVVYYTECNVGTSNPIKVQRVAELGLHLDPAINPLGVTRKSLFGYISYDGKIFSNPTGVDLNTILKVRVTASIAYDTSRIKLGFKEYNEYVFAQTVELNAMKAYLETGQYGS